MSFNLIYADKGIDLSGFAEGVNNGLKMRYEQEKFERNLIESEIKQFQTFFRADKLKKGDQKKWMLGIDAWMKSKKAELRLDKKRNATAEERNSLYEQSENIKTQLASLYQKSGQANEWLADAYKTKDMHIAKGRVLPVAFLNKITEVASKPSDEIDFATLLPAASFDIMPSSDEIITFSKALQDPSLYTETDRVESTTQKAQEIESDIPQLKGKKIRYYDIEKFAKPEAITEYVKTLSSNNSIYNQKMEEYGAFKRALKSDITSADSIAANDLLSKIANEAKVDKTLVNENHFWAYKMNAYKRKNIKTEEDDTELLLGLKAFNAANDAESLKLKKQSNALNAKVAGAQIGLANMYKFLGYIKSPEAEAAFNSSSPDSQFRSIFGDNKLDADKYFKAIKSLKKKGVKESVEDLYLGIKSKKYDLEQLSKEDD